jgi:hypothetical protein
MNRQEFIKTCAGGLCTCAVASTLGTARLAAEEKPAKEDWRLPFAQARYGKLLDILTVQLGEPPLIETLRQLGGFCASGMQLLAKHKGNVDAFIREFGEKYGEAITFDREKGIITIVGPERTTCFCPLVNTHTTPKVVCNCSLGWQQQVYETLLEKPVEVTLKESVLRGGKHCVFEIRIKQKLNS